ncbi:hypothetical protein [uncultured Desulfovibrio sp.]|nr:hypothetical protein [uncultured Desulfovibrio sp.]
MTPAFSLYVSFTSAVRRAGHMALAVQVFRMIDVSRIQLQHVF